MASTIKVDNVQNQPGTNVINKCGTTVNVGAASDNIRSAGNNLQASDGGNLISQCGTTVTLGASGDTVALASGATQTGFGRTGTVDWVTTPKVTGDSPVTAATGSGYFLNTTAGTITINLPAGAAGSIVSMADYAGTWQTNNVTVSPNGSEKIGSINANVPLNTEGQSVTLVYVDSTQGWINTMDSTSNVRGASYICGAVTGACNTLLTAPCGNYKLATFTGPGCFTVNSIGTGSPESNSVDYVVVAGGAGGGPSCAGGGGGAGGGGFRFSACGYSTPTCGAATALTVTATGYAIAVGAGGPAHVNGSTSTFSTISSAGGGKGGQQPGGGGVSNPGSSGGSGGGGSANPTPGPQQAGGTGDTPSVTPPQGNDGGSGVHIGGSHQGGGGGGGSACVGANVGTSPGSGDQSGVGGAGKGLPTAAVATSGESGPGSLYYFAAGAGGGIDKCSSCTSKLSPNPATGGVGGAGDGASNDIAGQAGTANTGGGGGGATGGGPHVTGGAGGSGIVIIRYRFQ